MFAGEFSPEALEAFGRLVPPADGHDPSTAGSIFAALGRSRFAADVATHSFRERAPLDDVRASLPEIDVPTLVIAGARDLICAPSASEVIAAGVPRAELVVIPKDGHFSFAEQPSCFAEAVRRFPTVDPSGTAERRRSGR